MQKERKPDGYWNIYDNCYEAAKQCKSRKEFQKKSDSAYNSALKHKWLDDYTWFESKHKPKGYWDKEHCEEASKKYNSRTEFSDGCGSAYIKALKNGWLDEFTWLEKKPDPFHDKIDNVYVILFPELNAVYVGRTVQPNKRNQEHKKSHTAYKFAKAHGIPVPDLTILKSGLDLDGGCEWEDYYVKKYRAEGWNVLNLAATGKNSGSRGSLGRDKWKHDNTYEEARKYTSITEFSTKNGTAYQKALKHGWLKEYTWFESKQKPKGYWDNKEHCKEESKKYHSRVEFQKKSPGAYVSARKHGWLDEFTWLERKCKPNGYWNNYQHCYDAAKECSSITEFIKKYCRGYDSAKEHGWLDEFTWLNLKPARKPAGFWDVFENTYNEARKYTSRTEFSDGCQHAYKAAYENKWLDKFTWFEPSRTKAKTVKQKTMDNKLVKEYPSVGEAARQNGWSQSHISNCCLGKRKSAYGYRWEYVEQ